MLRLWRVGSSSQLTRASWQRSSSRGPTPGSPRPASRAPSSGCSTPGTAASSTSSGEVSSAQPASSRSRFPRAGRSWRAPQTPRPCTCSSWTRGATRGRRALTAAPLMTRAGTGTSTAWSAPAPGICPLR